MGKANHPKPIHTGGTDSITTHTASRQRTKPANPAINGRTTGETMAANQELTDRTPVFFVAASNQVAGYGRPQVPRLLEHVF